MLLFSMQDRQHTMCFEVIQIPFNYRGITALIIGYNMRGYPYFVKVSLKHAKNKHEWSKSQHAEIVNDIQKLI